MYFDSGQFGRHWGDPPPAECKSCKGPINPGEPTAEVRFEPDDIHRLETMNGTYHATCAKPFLSIQKALDMLGRPWA